MSPDGSLPGPGQPVGVRVPQACPSPSVSTPLTEAVAGSSSSDQVHPARVRVSVRPGLSQEDGGRDPEAGTVGWQVATGNATCLGLDGSSRACEQGHSSWVLGSAPFVLVSV